MAFDAGMLACVVSELRRTLIGARVDKINQPGKDEILLLLHTPGGDRKLLIAVGTNPRISMTEMGRENPAVPPNFCMLLRKHLLGAKLQDVVQLGFERVAVLTFSARDEMGFLCTRHLVAEIMGKYSNLIFTDGEDKILGAVKIVDFSTSSLRQILPGMRYEAPPAQKKRNPLEETGENFLSRLRAFPKEKHLDRFLIDTYLGISASVAREISYQATGFVDQSVEVVEEERAWYLFTEVMNRIREERFAPTLVTENGKPVEYAFLPLTQYGYPLEQTEFSSVSALLDAFFGERDRTESIRQRASDILKILASADTRIRKKLEAQRTELAECERGEEYRLHGELITANLYQPERGMKTAELTDYADQKPDGTFGTRTVLLDERLSPVENAQRYFRKYAKTKTAKTVLREQVRKDEEELEYLATVFDALTHAETSADLAEIREELYRSGYASRMKGYSAPKKSTTPAVMKFRTRNGRTVYCGKNNVQNEYVTFRLAEKLDYWFHAKGAAGSHVILVTNGEEPAAEDFTDAAEIAAYYSKVGDGQNVGVDYSLAKNIKKPAGGKPGLVIYHTNWTAYVTPDVGKINGMRVK